MKTVKKLFITYVLLLSFCFVSIVLVHLIPQSWIKSNVIKSVQTIQSEGLYPNLLNFKLFQLDNFTDAVMHTIAMTGDHKKPVLSAMSNFYYRSENFLDIAVDADKVAKGQLDNLSKVSYGRYWQGYLVFLKPLLIIFDYSQIRILYYLLFVFLIGTISYLTFKNTKKRVVLFSFLITLVLFNVFIIPLSLQFSTVFIIAFIGIIIILLKPFKYANETSYLPLFFVIGGCTSFFDFLTVPLVTLGLPLLFLVENYDYEKKWKEKLLMVIKISIVWGIGYSFIWASKWLLGSVLTDVNIFNDAINSSAKRTSNDYRGMEMTISNITKFIWENIEARGLQVYVYISAIAMALLLFVYTRSVKSKEVLLNNIYLLLVAMMVPLWFLVLRNHSIQHGWFTWRAASVSIFALILFIINTTSLTQKKRNNG
jgi:hypothetical protein